MKRNGLFSSNPTGPIAALLLCAPCLLLAMAVLTGCKKAEEPPPPVDPASLPENQPPPRPILTQEKFGQLLYDMPLKDVVDHFGMEPSRQDSTYNEGVDGYTRPSLTSWYIWENPDGSFAKLGFTNDQLTDMVSEDLPAADTLKKPNP